ncbi:MAG: hypothetical protein K6B74_08315 [Ruminococcus sp.]|nr:hypothetical protein [Ruminococcus sp.]
MEDFELQSMQLIDILVTKDNMSRESAAKLWFGSETYKEIFRRGLTFISATCAYSELLLEKNKNPEWLKGYYG